MSNLTQRLLSAAVLLPIVITCFVVGGPWVQGLVMFAAIASLWEFGRVVARGDLLAQALQIVVGASTTWAALTVDNAIVALLAVQLPVMIFGILAVLRPRGDDLAATFRLFALQVFGVVYIALGVFAVARLREMGDGAQGGARGAFILVAFVATWANDSSAYFAGRAFGRHKMAPTISPKKTWEGFVGGAFGAPAFLFAGKAIVPATFAAVTPLDVVLVSIPVAVLGPVGDLVESMWKRAYDVKDSSNLIPGHGGMLDRIDAVFFVAPWVLGYFSAIKPLLS